jgi:hypothetical protein
MASRFPASPRDPDFVAAVVGVLATGALLWYAALVETAPSPETVALVLCWTLLPAGLAHELARR